MIHKKLILERNAKVWFTSDTHYGHKNICRGVSEWDLNDHGGHLSVRDFDTVDQMNDAIVNGINKYVNSEDYLIHLGDWSFGGIENIWNFRKRINCKNIILILGNHDHHIDKDRVLPNAYWMDNGLGDFDLGDLPTYVYGDERDELFAVNAESLFDSIHAYLELVVSSPKSKDTYNMMHFPLAIWNKGHHNRKMLHGHTHGSFQHEGRSLDVGVDMAFKLFGEYRPFSQEDINKFMSERDFKQFSHHNSKTN